MQENTNCYDAIIVGSGPCGTHMAHALKDKNILVLDVGNTTTAGQIPLSTTETITEHVLGHRFDGLEHLFDKNLSPKLKSPHMRYITEGSSDAYSPSVDYNLIQSFAKGGLANAWGAGVYQFDDDDLKNYPFSFDEIESCYERLQHEIPICGVNDDLSNTLGVNNRLLNPVNISQFSSNFLKKYERRKEKFKKEGVIVGRPRLAVDTDGHFGTKYSYDLTDFFIPHKVSIYNPAFLLDRLTKEGLNYRNHFKVETFVNTPDGLVDVVGFDTDTKQRHIYRCKKLILAAGAVQSAAITLKSLKKFNFKVPMMDNPVAFLPIIDFKCIGKKFETNAFPVAQLTLRIWVNELNSYAWGSLYSLNGPLANDVAINFPFHVTGRNEFSKIMASGIGVFQLFFPEKIETTDNNLQIDERGEIRIQHKSNRSVSNHLQGFSKFLRRMGYFSRTKDISIPVPGSSIHYAGTIPYTTNERSWGCDKFCKVNLTNNVYVVDGSWMPALPAKNHTFTLMANVHRIANHLKQSLNT